MPFRSARRFDGAEHRVALDEVGALPYAPEHGVRYNPSKLLLDPYAHPIGGE